MKVKTVLYPFFYVFYNVCCIDSLSSEAAISRPGVVLLDVLLYCSTVDIP